MAAFIFLGPPASGKGTQGHRLAEQYEIPYLSTGGLLRRSVEEGTELGKMAESYLKRAQYVPDEVVSPIVKNWLSEQTGEWVLDGFPRTLVQARLFDQWIEDKNHSVVAIHLEVPFDEVERRSAGRLECGGCHWAASVNDEPACCAKCGGTMRVRDDDDSESFKSRYRFYEECVLPVAKHYQEKDQLVSLSAVRSPDAVYGQMVRELKSFLG